MSFSLDRREAKTSTVLIGCAYIINSGYYVTMDNLWLNELMRYSMIILMAVFLKIVLKRTCANFKAI